MSNHDVVTFRPNFFARRPDVVAPAASGEGAVVPPSLRPGLYVGDYPHEFSGHFGRETLLLERRRLP